MAATSMTGCIADLGYLDSWTMTKFLSVVVLVALVAVTQQASQDSDLLRSFLNSLKAKSDPTKEGTLVIPLPDKDQCKMFAEYLPNSRWTFDQATHLCTIKAPLPSLDLPLPKGRISRASVSFLVECADLSNDVLLIEGAVFSFDEYTGVCRVDFPVKKYPPKEGTLIIPLPDKDQCKMFAEYLPNSHWTFDQATHLCTIKTPLPSLDLPLPKATHQASLDNKDALLKELFEYLQTYREAESGTPKASSPVFAPGSPPKATSSDSKLSEPPPAPPAPPPGNEKATSGDSKLSQPPPAPPAPPPGNEKDSGLSKASPPVFAPGSPPKESHQAELIKKEILLKELLEYLKRATSGVSKLSEPPPAPPAPPPGNEKGKTTLWQQAGN